VRPSSLLYFYRLRLRERWIQELFSLVGIAIGVALLFAAQVANTSLAGSVGQLVEGTVGQAELQVISRDPHGFDLELLERVRRAPGVRAAAPVIEARTIAIGPKAELPVTLFGADRSLARLGGPLLRQLRATQLGQSDVLALPAEIANQLGVPLGGQIKLQVGANVVRTRLAAQLGESEIGGLVHNPLALAPLAYAQRLSGLEGKATRIFVVPEPGRRAQAEASLERLAGRSLNVTPADFDTALFRQAAAPTNQSTALFATISALVGFLFAFSASLLTLGERRRLIEALRQDGYSPGAILQVLLFDAIILGLAAAVVGLALGDRLSQSLFDEAPNYLSFAFTIGNQRIVEWQSAVIAVCGGLAATAVAALVPLGDVLRRRPAAPEGAGGSMAQARPLLAAGTGFLALSLAVLFLAPRAAAVGVAALIASLLLTLPALLRLLLALLERALLPIRSAIPMISIGELKAMSARSIAVSATGALAVFGCVAIQGARGDLQQGLDRSTRDVNGVADIWVAPGGAANALAVSPFPPSDEAALRALSAVQTVRLYRSGFLDIGDRRVWVLAQPTDAANPVPRSQIVTGDVSTATRRVRAGGWAVVSEAIAAEQHLKVGDRFTLPAPSPIQLRVAALSTNIGWAPGTVVVNPVDYRTAWRSDDATAYQVILRPGTPPADGLAEVRRAIAHRPALLAETEGQRVARHRATSRQGLSRLNQLSSMVLIAAILAMAAATGGMLWQRRARLAALKLDGFDDLTVWKALMFESAVLLGAGCLLGAIFGLVGQQLLDQALSTVTGFPVVPSIAVGVALASLTIVTAVAVAITAIPGYLAARVGPAAGLQD
jgi:putative ABC transport system permease protein